MADPRTFTLVGEFRDGITPSLEKINNSISSLKRNLGGFGGKRGGFSDLTQSMGKVINAHIKLNEQVRDLRSELTKSLPVLKEYRREVGKAVSANMHLGGKKFNKNNNPHLQFLDEATRRTRELAAESRRVNLGTRTPRRMGGGGGGGGSMPSPSRTVAPRGGGGSGYGGGSNRGGGGRGGGPGGFHMAEFGFAYTLGEGISQPIQNAIVKGFEIGVAFMVKPFEYFAGAFGERVKDQLSDLKAAGGLFSISQRSKTPFLNTIDDAIQYQQDTNKVFAKMAAALPGVTNDYVQVGKRLSDTMGRIASGDFQNALQEANRIRATEEGRKFYGGTITGTGQEATKQVITTLLGEMTKKTTIAGLGGRSGAGGIAGAYGLPGLTERMLSQQEVSMGQFQRYAAVFSDPTIQDALSRNVDLINKTLPNTTARFKTMQKLLDEVVTPDLIEKLRTSVDGVYQGLRSAILDPDTGLFGLGRQFEDFGYKINQYGQYVVDKEGNKIKDSLSIFEIVADIFSSAGQVLLPLVDALPLVFDPLKKVASILMDARHYAAQFALSFNEYREGLKILSEGKGKEFLKGTIDVRAALGAINNVLLQVGAIDKSGFLSTAEKLGSKDFNTGEMLKQMLDSLLNSDAATGVGKIIGEIVGTVFSEMSGVTGFLSGRIGKSNKLFDGIKSAFEKAGGPEAIKNIFKDVFGSMVKIMHSIGKLIPFEGYVLAALAVTLPAAVQGIGMAIAQGVTGMLGMGRNAVLDQFGNATPLSGNGFEKARAIYKLDKARGKVSAGSPVTRTGAPKSAAFRAIKASRITNPQFPGVSLGMTPGVGGVTGPFRAPGIPKGSKVTPPQGFKVQITSIAKNALPATSNFLKGVQGRMGAGGIAGLKNPLGMLGKFGGVLTIVTGALMGLEKILSGGSIFEGLGAAAGPIIGTIIGTALLGPLGGVIGGMIGSMEEVTRPLGNAAQAIAGTIGTTFELLGQIGSDLLGILNGLISKIPGVSKGFNLLEFAIFALLSPFKLLEIAISGIYDLYLWIKSKTVGVSPEEQARMNERNTVRLTDELTIQGRQAAGNSLASQKAAEYAKFKEAQGRGDTQAMNRIAEYMKSIDRMLVQQGGKPAVAQSAKPGENKKVSGLTPTSADMAWYNQQMSKTPASGPAVTAAQTTATNVQQVNQKAATQVAHASGIRNAAVKTQANTTTANTTLGNIRVGIIAVSNKLSSLQSAILGDLNNIQAGVTRISSLLASGSLKVKTDTPFFPGAHGVPMGGASGSLGAAQSLASQNGLGLTSYFRAGDKGMHGVGRAMDFSNGVNTPQQMAFAQQMISRYGSSLAELIYTPLGFGIKNGQKVPLSYWGERTNAMHYNHVHVAFAKGKEDGKMFSSQKAAGGWENSMVPGSVKIASVTANSGDGGGFGALTIGDINLTVNAGNVSDPDQLASIVAIKIGEAVADARAASIFV